MRFYFLYLLHICKASGQIESLSGWFNYGLNKSGVGSGSVTGLFRSDLIRYLSSSFKFQLIHKCYSGRVRVIHLRISVGYKSIL